MWGALILGLLFLAGAVFNVFFRPEPDLANASVGLGIFVCLLAVFMFLRVAERKNEEFLAWILANARAIQAGGARFGAALVTPTTVLTRYQAALSFLIVTFKIPSRVYFNGAPARSTFPYF